MPQTDMNLTDFSYDLLNKKMGIQLGRSRANREIFWNKKENIPSIGHKTSQFGL